MSDRIIHSLQKRALYSKPLSETTEWLVSDALSLEMSRKRPALWSTTYCSSFPQQRFGVLLLPTLWDLTHITHCTVHVKCHSQNCESDWLTLFNPSRCIEKCMRSFTFCSVCAPSFVILIRHCAPVIYFLPRFAGCRDEFSWQGHRANDSITLLWEYFIIQGHVHT